MVKQNLKNIFILFLLLVLIHTNLSFPSPKVALVLSGGGARGLAQIGVLKSFEKHNIRPDLLVTTSIGAIIGGFYSAGFSADSIEKIAKSIDWDRIFSNSSLRKTLFVAQKENLSNYILEIRFGNNFKPIFPSALSYGQFLYNFLNPFLINASSKALYSFDSLCIPLRIVATDLLSGEKVVFSKGNLLTAIMASCAVPLVFYPIEVDSFLCIDGGITSNIPVEIARKCGAEKVIAVDVTSPLWTKEHLENPVRLVDQIISIGISEKKKKEMRLADIVIEPEIGEIRNTDFYKIDSLIYYGYIAAEKLSDSIKSIFKETPYGSDNIGNTTLEDSSVKNNYVQKELPIEVRDIVTEGNIKTRQSLIVRASGLNIGDTLTPSLTKSSLSSIYSTSLFESVNIVIDTSGICKIIVKEKKYLRIRGGLRFDEFHLGEGYLEPAYENLIGRGITSLMHLQYGLRREKYTFEIHSNYLYTKNLAHNLVAQLYSSKERILESDTTMIDSITMTATTSIHQRVLSKTGLNFIFGTQLGRFSLVTAGLRMEKFMVQKEDRGILSDILGNTLKRVISFFSLRLIIDSIDRMPFPTSGLKLYLSLGGSTKSIGSRFSFVKLNGRIEKYTTFLKYHTFITKFNFALADVSVLPEVEKIYLGGAIEEERHPEMSIYYNYVPFSGLPSRAISGSRAAVMHLEYRVEVKRALFVHLLTDLGNSWSYITEDYFSLVKKFPLGIGVGVSYMTPVGPLKFSYGRLVRNTSSYEPKERDVFYFSAGYEF
ncbi:MAG: patatin-like phospholipase family protein [Chitinispirillaceae bacterium]|nr:patatin-like phospholipase family protein [Chitinispirillaceae bacterium]